jgi:long-subunit acyl-CoA synthetase (AMP-forming)
MIEVINVMSAYNNVTDDWVEDNIKKSRETLLGLSARIQDTEKKILALIGIDPEEVKKQEDIKKDLEERMKKEKFTANDLSISHDEDINKLIGHITDQLRLEGPGAKPNGQAPNDDDDDDDNAIPV